MAMRETPRSIRAELILVGVIGIAINALAFIKNHDPVFVGLSLIGVGFARCSLPSYDRALHALRTWLDSWAGIGHVDSFRDAPPRIRFAIDAVR